MSYMDHSSFFGGGGGWGQLENHFTTMERVTVWTDAICKVENYL